MRPILAAGAYYGNRMKASHLGDFILTEYEYSPGYRIPKHSHQRAYIKLVIEGSYEEFYEGRRRECRPSTVVFHPAGEVHSEQIGSAGGRTFGIEFGPRFQEMIHNRFPSPIMDRPADFQGGPLAWLAMRLYEEFQFLDAFSCLAVEGLALEMIGVAARNTARASQRPLPEWLARVVEILRTGFTANFSLSQIAREVGVHPVHLARAFRRHAHCSMGEFVRQLRVDFACRQLASSVRPLSEIALAAGFADQSHFSRTFKRLTGLTPAAFRKHRRQR